MREVRLHFPAFADETRRHGGIKRSEQLRIIAGRTGAATIMLPQSHGDALRAVRRSPFSIMAALPSAVSLLWRCLSWKGFAAALLYGAWLHVTLKGRGASDVMLEVAPNRNIVLGNFLVAYSIPFSAWPHNIEFMVPGQRQSYFRTQDAAFAAEMRVYRHARSVHAISDFDANALRALGIESVCSVSYDPSTSDKAVLLSIRQRRKTSQKRSILILGTAANPPTRRGLTELLKMISEQQDERSFTLAGFGTEVLRPIAPSNVLVMGGISDDALTDLLVECEALLIYQPPTSGMLTRIVEASIAGVPINVIGGYMQAIGLAERGVYAIRSLDDIRFSAANGSDETNSAFPSFTSAPAVGSNYPR